MKQLDFEHGTVTGNILGAAVQRWWPILKSGSTTLWTAFILHVSPKVGTAALGQDSLPLIVDHHGVFESVRKRRRTVIFHLQGEKETQAANDIMNTSFSMLCL
ncbi:MAG: hypothetical protein ACLUD2_18840 [Clostridium sp.]